MFSTRVIPLFLSHVQLLINKDFLLKTDKKKVRFIHSFAS